jgi:RNA polymerase sigma factor (TIGR02999 family)
MNDVTEVLRRVERGDPSAAEQLLPLIYVELRRLAAAKMAGESPDHTLQPTALVHEAYIRLVGRNESPRWESRGHFFAAASVAMRRILVESARRKRSLRHGGELSRRQADPDREAAPQADDKILAIDEALERLAEQHPEVAKLVELKYFAGLTLDEAAAALGVSSRTSDRYWAYAKAWLYRELRESDRE